MTDTQPPLKYHQAYYRARSSGYNVRVRDYYEIVYDPTDSLIPGLCLPPHVLAADVADAPDLYEGLCCERKGVVYVVEDGEFVEAGRVPGHD